MKFLMKFLGWILFSVSLLVNLGLLFFISYGFSHQKPWTTTYGPSRFNAAEIHGILDKEIDEANRVAIEAGLPRPMDRTQFDKMISFVGLNNPARDNDLAMRLVRNLRDFADIYEINGHKYMATGELKKVEDSQRVASIIRRAAMRIEELVTKPN